MAPRRPQMLGLAYKAATGAPGIFDTRIAYVAESGVGDARVRRVAIMDSDGYDHSFLTKGEAIVLTPRLSPKAAARRLCQLRHRHAAGSASRRRVGRRSGRWCPATR